MAPSASDDCAFRSVHSGNWQIERGFAADAGMRPDNARWIDSTGCLALSIVGHGAASHYRLSLIDQISADVFPGPRIVARARHGVSACTIDHFIADQVIPRMLAHQGKFVFHAGAVRTAGSALVFLGQSGHGKSTLAASFDRAGFKLVGDDAMTLSWVGAVPQVNSVYPSLRLLPDSLEALMPDVEVAGPVAHYSTKQRIEVRVAGDNGLMPIPLRALFRIEPPSGQSAVDLAPLSPAEVCVALVESSFSLDPTDLGRARERLDEAGRLANAIPGFRLSYPRDYELLPQVRAAIFDALENGV